MVRCLYSLPSLCFFSQACLKTRATKIQICVALCYTLSPKKDFREDAFVLSIIEKWMLHNVLTAKGESTGTFSLSSCIKTVAYC